MARNASDPKKYVVVEMSGGVVQNHRAEPGIEVIFVDFDEVCEVEDVSESLDYSRRTMRELAGVPKTSTVHSYAIGVLRNYADELKKLADDPDEIAGLLEHVNGLLAKIGVKRGV